MYCRWRSGFCLSLVYICCRWRSMFCLSFV
jgi:hypothetical protein